MFRKPVVFLLILLLCISLFACISPSDNAEQAAASPDIQNVLLEAEAAYEAGDFDMAFELSQKVVQTDPANALAWEMVQQSTIAQTGDEYLQRLPDRRYRLNPETFLIEQANGRNYFILDVRGPDEFAEGHIENAVNIPLTELVRNIKELPTTTTPILIYCQSQKRATHALVIMRELGYVQAFNLEGGYSAYLDFIANNALPGAGPTPTLPPVSSEGC